MPSRTDPLRMTANALDKLYEPPKWIKRMSMNDRLNYIVRMYSETCGDNWYLWVETAIEGLPTLIYSLKAISKVDVIKEVLEQNYRCGLRQALGTGKKQARTAAQKAKVFFWKIERVRGQLFWYWLIAEALTAYVMQWQSIVVQEQRCTHPPHSGPCVLDTPGSTLGSIIGTTTLFYRSREFDPSGWSGTTSTPTVIAADEVGTYNVGFNVTCIWGLPANITWHPEVIDGLGHIVATGASVTSASNVASTSSCFAVVSCPVALQAEFTSRIVVTQSPGGTIGACQSGTFTVGLSL